MEYDIRPLQLHLLDILLSFQQVCEKQGLKYYMVDGSLLGAMRHKGFIPWDDDMDIAMPRDDYERLIQHSKEWLPEPLEFVCYENDPKYPLHFGKIQDASTTLIERPHLYYYLAHISEGEALLKKILEPYKGKFVLLDIWGTWCGPCKEALSHSTEEYARLKDYNIEFLYLANRSPQDSWENVI